MMPEHDWYGSSLTILHHIVFDLELGLFLYQFFYFVVLLLQVVYEFFQ